MARIIVVAVLFLCFRVSLAQDVYMSATFEDKKCVITEGQQGDALAVARYRSSLESTGWDLLEVTTYHSNYDDSIPYCMGAVEGAVTHQRIRQHYLNMKDLIESRSPGRKIQAEVTTWIKDNLEFVKQFVKGDPKDPLVSRANMMLQQFDGLLFGYNSKALDADKLTEQDLWMLQSLHDVLDVVNKFNSEIEGTPQEITDLFFRSGGATMVVKLTDVKDECFVSHNTWGTYSSLLRMMKKYHYVTPSPSKAPVAFTGYPGMLHSGDDFYTLGSSIAIGSASLWMISKEEREKITAKGLPMWVRVMIANTGASNAATWSSFIKSYGTWTDNKQFLFVCLDEFVARTDLPTGSVTLIESWAEHIHTDDVTSSVNKGYFAISDVPYSNAARTALGYEAQMKTDPESKLYLSLTDSSRPRLLEKLIEKVHNVDAMIFISRYNNYISDAEGKRRDDHRDPAASLASRFDLRSGIPSSPRVASGAIDAKITSSYLLSHDSTFIAVNGPTNSHQLESISIDSLAASLNFSHEGISNSWAKKKFEWVQNRWDPLARVEPVSPFTLFATIISGALVVIAGLVTFIIIFFIMYKQKKGDQDYVAINDDTKR